MAEAFSERALMETTIRAKLLFKKNTLKEYYEYNCKDIFLGYLYE